MTLGSIITWALLIRYCFYDQDPMLLVAAGLFANAGRSSIQISLKK